MSQWSKAQCEEPKCDLRLLGEAPTETDNWLYLWMVMIVTVNDGECRCAKLLIQDFSLRTCLSYTTMGKLRPLGKNQNYLGVCFTSLGLIVLFSWNNDDEVSPWWDFDQCWCPSNETLFWETLHQLLWTIETIERILDHPWTNWSSTAEIYRVFLHWASPWKFQVQKS